MALGHERGWHVDHQPSSTHRGCCNWPQSAVRAKRPSWQRTWGLMGYAATLISSPPSPVCEFPLCLTTRGSTRRETACTINHHTHMGLGRVLAHAAQVAYTATRWLHRTTALQMQTYAAYTASQPNTWCVQVSRSPPATRFCHPKLELAEGIWCTVFTNRADTQAVTGKGGSLRDFSKCQVLTSRSVHLMP